MTAILAKLFGKAASNIASIAFVGVLVLLVFMLMYSGWDTLKGKLGFDTVDSVKKELIKERGNTDTLVSATEDLTVELKTVEGISDLKLEAVTETNISNNKVNAELLKLLDKRDRQIAELIKSKTSVEEVKAQKVKVDNTVVTKIVVTNPTGEEPPSELQKKISSVQINAIWDVYNSTQEPTYV